MTAQRIQCDKDEDSEVKLLYGFHKSYHRQNCTIRQVYEDCEKPDWYIQALFQFDRFDRLIQQYAAPVTIEVRIGSQLVPNGTYLTVVSILRKLFICHRYRGRAEGEKGLFYRVSREILDGTNSPTYYLLKAFFAIPLRNSALIRVC